MGEVGGIHLVPPLALETDAARERVVASVSQLDGDITGLILDLIGRNQWAAGWNSSRRPFKADGLSAGIPCG
jgi:hypothetical protein